MPGAEPGALIAARVAVVEKLKIVAGLCVFALVMGTGWQIASCEFANYLLEKTI